MIAARAGGAWHQSIRSSRPMAAAGRTAGRGWLRAGVWAALLVVVLVLAACARDPRRRSRLTEHEIATAEPVATFSIVAYDPDTGDLGVAVQSRFFGVGSVVPWARAGVGAVATQSLANTTYGPRGLDLLVSGASPEHVVAELPSLHRQRVEIAGYLMPLHELQGYDNDHSGAALGDLFLLTDQPGQCPDCSPAPVPAVFLPDLGTLPEGVQCGRSRIRISGIVDFGYQVDAEKRASMLRLVEAQIVATETPDS